MHAHTQITYRALWLSLNEQSIFKFKSLCPSSLKIFQLILSWGSPLKDQSSKKSIASTQHQRSYTIQEKKSFKILSGKTVGLHREFCFFSTLTGRAITAAVR